MRLPRSIIKKIVGFEEIYTVGARKIGDDSAPFKCIPYSKDYWYADPLTFGYDNKVYLFTEAFDRKDFIGRIAVSTVDNEGKISIPKVIIKENYHMSFPYVFQWNDDIFMIPESCENMSINLYRCLKFPERWELEAQFSTSEQFVDAVVQVIDAGKISLLGSTVNPDNPLQVGYRRYTIKKNESGYYCQKDENFSTDWNHNDRNAGKPIERNGKTLIPTQESSSRDYGIRVNFRELDKNMIPKDEIISSMDIGNVKFDSNIKKTDMIGVHTYSCQDSIEVTDLRYMRFSFGTNIRRIKHLICRKA